MYFEKKFKGQLNFLFMMHILKSKYNFKLQFLGGIT